MYCVFSKRLTQIGNLLKYINVIQEKVTLKVQIASGGQGKGKAKRFNLPF